jgi:hypothetical protein
VRRILKCPGRAGDGWNRPRNPGTSDLLDNN